MQQGKDNVCGGGHSVEGKDSPPPPDFCTDSEVLGQGAATMQEPVLSSSEGGGGSVQTYTSSMQQGDWKATISSFPHPSVQFAWFFKSNAELIL